MTTEREPVKADHWPSIRRECERIAEAHTGFSTKCRYPWCRCTPVIPATAVQAKARAQDYDQLSLLRNSDSCATAQGAR